MTFRLDGEYSSWGRARAWWLSWPNNAGGKMVFVGAMKKRWVERKEKRS
jgi:hypothetical protein